MTCNPAQPGQDAEVQVKFEGFPKPNVEWFFGENEIHEHDESEEYELLKDEYCTKLKVLNTGYEDEGKYTVRLTNEFNTAEKSVHLEVGGNIFPLFVLFSSDKGLLLIILCVPILLIWFGTLPQI